VAWLHHILWTGAMSGTAGATSEAIDDIFFLFIFYHPLHGNNPLFFLHQVELLA
jgi:hypothetical protein